MKLKNKIVLASVFLSALSISIQANASIEDELANICNVVKANDKGELRKKIKNVQSDYKLRLGDYYDGISCDGNSLIRTAILNEAVDAGELLVKKMPRKKLREPEQDGVELAAWIETNGLAGNPIAVIVSERL